MLTRDQGDKIVNHRNQFMERELQKKAEVDFLIDKGVVSYEREVMAKDILNHRKKT
jgi:hypothetical protein